MIEYFDKSGRPTAFCDSGTDVYLWNGRPAAFIHDDVVFAFTGQAIGRVTDGWICDLAGDRLLFEYDAVGGPPKPERQKRSAVGARARKPTRHPPVDVSTHAAPSLSWSDRDFAELI
ncbi:4-fold beta flower protein [Methylobacterium sp. NEAU K]|uniref:4-fold beta flower protein n=1 Tax=Methylobacterium sp. NEAU K TaxID=3064946 RepID=UPI00273592CC|nr:hypothetical protein [Methylobacterium sp. NEAU K]MDP4004683.1 hypothetical protein [Methylobacterium sp. NEAU K]